MTITYQFNVANSSFFAFGKLLLKWRGSVYKLIYKELLFYALGYAIISTSYRLYMTEEQKRTFERLVLYCNKTIDLIPLSFVLGFYVTCIVTRWMNQFVAIPWPDRTMHCVAMYVNGTDDRGKLIRRTLMRYINLCIVLLYQSISGAVKKRFASTKQLVDAGFMTSEERTIFDIIPTKVNKHWVPLIWFVNLLQTAQKEKRIESSAAIKHILEEVNELRSKTSLMWGYDWISIPLVYTQVVTLTSHLFFLTCLISRQYLDPNQGYPGHDFDLYFPIFTFFQFFFFMGWLKVAEQLINPLGEDDDDFETNWMIDRNIQKKDYTEASLIHKIPTYRGSTMHMVIPNQEQNFVFGQYLNQVSFCESFLTCLSQCFCCRSICHKIWNSRLIYREKPSKTALPIDQTVRLNKKHTRTLGSKSSLFENHYLGYLNRDERRNSSFKRLSYDYTPGEGYVCGPSNLPYRSCRPSIDRTALQQRMSITDHNCIIEEDIVPYLEDKDEIDLEEEK
ncbi:bestrophin-3-like [Centruroides sculpturatus]|uniref:bestrophin-3-like n=1 Tax=Centruroides sculpturatus TaxID=218467 RepID=UPI000C6DB47B|nr:bestrophin-3-like [Centruroides sculpturatus]